MGDRMVSAPYFTALEIPGLNHVGGGLMTVWGFCTEPFIITLPISRFDSNGLCHAKMSLSICRQQRPRSACAFAQSDQSLCCPLTDSFGGRGVVGWCEGAVYLTPPTDIGLQLGKACYPCSR